MMIIRAIVCSAVVALAVSTASDPAAAEGDGFGRSQAPALLEDAWQVRITPYICSTGVALPPPFAFDSVVVFSSGGTMTETTSNPRFLPGQRSPGMGYWERNGRSSYDVVFQAFVQFTGGN